MAATSSPPGTGTERRSGSIRRFVADEAPWFLSLVTLSALAIAQPVLPVISSDPTVFQGRASTPWVIVSFALAVTFGPALLLWLVELAAARVSPSLRRRLHDVFLVLLGWAFFVQLVERIGDLPTRAVQLLGLALAIGLVVLYERIDAVRRWLAYTSPLALYLLVAFLFFSPAWTFVRGSSAPTTAAAADADVDTPVVLVVFDELGTSALLDGEGGIDADLFPNFARLAAGATWYRNATTVGPHTPQALPAILTGQYPPTDLAEATSAASYDGSLFSLLSPTHELNVHEPFTRFCTAAIGCQPHPAVSAREELSTLVDLAQVVWEGAVDPDRPADIPLNVAVRDDGNPAGYFDRFLASLDEGSRGPRLDFVHVLLPHAPYRLLPDGSRHDAPAVPDGAASWQGPWDDEEATWGARQRHLLQAQFADAELGRLLDHLESSGQYDEALVVVTADHGSAFVAGEPSRHLTAENAAHIAWVPLFVKAPGQVDGDVDDVPIENVDVVPLIADELGLEVPWSVDGVVPGERDDAVAHLVPWEADDEPWADRVLDDGDVVELDRDDGFAEVLATTPLGLPGTDARWRPYQRGRYAALVGEALDELEVEAGSVDGTLATSADARRVPGAPTPVYVAGTVDGPDAVEVAIVVDDRIVALARTRPDDGGRFSALLPASVLREGSNPISLYVVSGSADDPVLRPVALR